MGYNEKVHLAYEQRSGYGMNVPGIPKLRRTAFPRKAAYLILSACFVLLFFVHIFKHTAPARAVLPQLPTKSKILPDDTTFTTNGSLPCQNLPGADDVLVVLKTGATEIRDKLPVHLNTTLRCYPHYMLFSDYQESIHGAEIHDALEFVTPAVQETHEDFELWRRLRKGGRNALKPQELSGPVSKPQDNNSGKAYNPGWKLDKWKFLPMVNRAYHEYPDKKWYVFVETDTYILWQTLLNYLAALDETQPYYIGGQIWIGDMLFAHGGTGYVVSNSAMRNVTKMFQEKQTEWETFTSRHWAGDAVLGKAFKDSGTPLTPAWPIWQGDDIGKITYWREDGGHRQWCTPTVSYHHLSPGVVEELWQFEQDWIQDTDGDTKAFLRHKDMFWQFLLPRIGKQRINWDNHADQDRGPVRTLQDCKTICEEDEGCLQYRLTPDLRCLSSTRPMLGDWSKGVESGWVVERIRNWGDKMEKCRGDDWIT